MKDNQQYKSERRTKEEGFPASARILCADDRPVMRACYAAVLTNAGYDVTTVSNGQEAWDALQSGDFDLLVTDNRMPRLKGEELVLRIRAAGMDQPIIVAASDTEFFTERHNRWLHVTVLEKPFTLHKLSDAVGGLLCSAHRVGWGESLIEDDSDYCHANPNR